MYKYWLTIGCFGVALAGCGSDKDKVEGTGGALGGAAGSTGGSINTGGIANTSGGNSQTGGNVAATGGAGGTMGGTSGVLNSTLGGTGGVINTGGTSTGGSGGTSSGGAPSGGVGGATGGGNAGPNLALCPGNSISGGVITNRPGLTFTKVGGQLDLLAARLWTTLGGSFKWSGYVKNNTTKVQCIPLGTVTMNGVDVLTVVDGLPYDEGFSTVSDECLAPGDVGGVNGIELSIPTGSLAGITTIAYNFQTLAALNGTVPHPSTPQLVQANIVNGVIGPGISGKIKTTLPITNTGLTFYPHDQCGLPFEKQTAYPGNLANLAANTEYPFETIGGDDAFTGFRTYISFITVQNNLTFQSLRAAAPSPHSEREAEFARRKELVRQRNSK